MDDAEPEEQQHGHKCQGDEIGDVFHRNVQLPAYGLLSACFAFEFFGGETHGFAYDAPGLDDADDAGHGYTADADAAYLLEYFVRHHSGKLGRAEVAAHQRDDEPPYEDTAGKNNEGIF